MTMQPPAAPPPGYSYGGGPVGAMPACSWHPDRATALTCSRCGRPACPECLTPASVGFHCRACVAEARAAQRSAAPRTVVGARAYGRSFAGALHGAQPLVTYVLIAVNILVFLVVAAQSRSLSDFNSSSVFNGSLLVPMVVAGGQWWRLVASGFLHLSVTHIALNMLTLYFIGMPLERVLGGWRYLVLYLLSLLGGSASVMLLDAPTSASAGASGAIFGLMGALLVTMKRLNLNLRQIGIVVVLNLGITFAIPGISWQAHVGGLVIGALVGAGIVYAPAAKRLQWQIGTFVAAAIVLAAIFVVKDLSMGTYSCVDTFTAQAKCYFAAFGQGG